MMEGSNGGHTMIRIGLSLMKLNQDTLLSMDEMEDCLKLLLSKDLWRVVDADTLIGTAGGEMKSLVPTEKLRDLDTEYKATMTRGTEKRGGELQAVAGRFLGRLKWTASQLTVDTTNIAPPMLIRTLSKASFASSPQDMEQPTLLRAQTESTMMSRSTSSTSFRGTSDNERALHGQIEELVRVLGEVQRKVGESEDEKDSLRSENVRLREMLARVANVMSGNTPVEELSIPSGPGTPGTMSLSDEISEILSSPGSVSSMSNYSESPLEEDLRTQLTQTQHTLNQERQANLLLQQQLSTTETELSRTRSALLDLRTKYTDANRRERTPSNMSSDRTPSNSSLRELKLVVRTQSENSTLGVNTSASSVGSSPNSGGSSWGGWFGRRE
jgi:hypothetical protein